jgi:ankyrin repeat protein
VLLVCGRSGRSDLVAHLIAKGANVNASNNRGFTPLHHAAGRGDVELIQSLLV